MKPFLKWAGGKRWLVKRHPDLFMVQFDRYVEPFLGSGAVFFHVAPPVSLLSDLNKDLVNVYVSIRDDYKRVFSLLKTHSNRHSDEYYYKLRANRFSDAASRAAQFLYLNRTCWNGLYRENLKGEFNVPRGTKDTVIFPDEDFSQISGLLKKAKILSSDFERIIEGTRSGDFVFIDPPYTVRHNTNGFVKYNERIFSWADQVRLCSALKKKADSGATYLMTNACHQSVIELYRDFATVIPTERVSILSADRRYRGTTNEALILIGASWKLQSAFLPLHDEKVSSASGQLAEAAFAD
jgi:DNA adenine methylase